MSGWRRVAIGLAAMLAVSNSGAALATGAEQQYRLAPGDRIAVTVMGQTELSGAFTIDNAGEIHLPLLGPVNVAGRTTQEGQKRIQDELSKGFLRQPSVFVRIEEARPVHIFGDVTNPGSFKYQYGSIVKTAIAQAGGYGSIAKSAAAMPDLVLAHERVFSLSARRDMLQIKMARLEAQLSAARKFAVPAPVTLPKAEADRIAAQEQRALELKVDAFTSHRELLLSQKPELAAEDAALAKQIAAETRQIEILSQRSSQYQALKSKGLAREKEVLDHELAVAGKQSNVWRLEAERSRLRLARNDLDAKIHLAGEALKEQTLQEIALVQSQLAEIEATLPSARELRASRLHAVGSIAESAPAFAITITRARIGTGTAVTIEASEASELEPGDIVEVRMLRRSLDAMGAAGTRTMEPKASQ